MKDVFITSAGVFLPNDPVSNEEMEDYLGKLYGKESSLNTRILKQSGITNRYYALNKKQESTHSHADLAIKAIEAAILKNKAYPELQELSKYADKHYPKTTLGVYHQALYYEKMGEFKKALK